MNEIAEVIQQTESSIRFAVRQEWREEGCLTVHRKYPLDSWQRGVALDESHKIRFEDQQSI